MDRNGNMAGNRKTTAVAFGAVLLAVLPLGRCSPAAAADGGTAMARQTSQMPKDAVAIWRNGKTDADPHVAVTGKYMTFYARVRPSDHSGDAPLFAGEDSTDPHGAIFTYANSKFQYIWRTLPAAEQVVPGTDVSKWSKAAQAGVLPMVAAVPKGEENQWHDLVMRFDCSKLTLFLDGVPMREEYPHGDLVGFTGPFRVGAGVETVAIWNRSRRAPLLRRMP